MENPQDIGAALRAAREAKGMSIANAAMQCNLSIGILEKLETNQFSQMTAPVFARGYLMQYSRFLGLNPDVMAAEFNRLGVKETEIRLSSANIASQSRSFKRYHLGTWLMVVPIVGLAGLILTQVFNPNSWLINQFKQTFNNERAQLTEGEDNLSGSQITLQIGTENTPNNELTPIVPDTVPTLTSLSAENTNENIVLTSVEPQETALNSEQSNETTTAVSPTENVVIDTPVANTDVASVNPNVSNVLQLKINGESWVEVRNKEHRIVASKVHQAGDMIEVPVDGAPYEFNIGRPEVVSLMIKGQDVDLAQYRVGKSRRFKVNAHE